jgi:hypothetical protein
MKDTEFLELIWLVVFLGGMLVGATFVYFAGKRIFTSFIHGMKGKYGYEPITLFNALFFMAFNTILWIFVALPHLKDVPKSIPDVSPYNLVVTIILFVSMKAYIFNNFRVKTNTLIAIASILALDTLTVIVTVVTLTVNLHVKEVACMPFFILPFFPGRSWILLFSKKER